MVSAARARRAAAARERRPAQAAQWARPVSRSGAKAGDALHGLRALTSPRKADIIPLGLPDAAAASMPSSSSSSSSPSAPNSASRSSLLAALKTRALALLSSLFEKSRLACSGVG